MRSTDRHGTQSLAQFDGRQDVHRKPPPGVPLERVRSADVADDGVRIVVAALGGRTINALPEQLIAVRLSAYQCLLPQYRIVVRSPTTRASPIRANLGENGFGMPPPGRTMY